MPLLLKGNYKGTFGSKQPPQWLTAKDISNTKFPKNNSGIVLIADTAKDVAYYNSWQAISIEWFDKLVDKSESSSNGNSDKKFW